MQRVLINDHHALFVLGYQVSIVDLKTKMTAAGQIGVR